MEDFRSITREQIESQLNGEQLKINRIISAALIFGPSLFLLVILFMYQKESSTMVSLHQDSIVDLMSIVLLVFSVIIYSVFLFFPRIFLKKENVKKQLVTLTNNPNGNEITDLSLKIIFLDRTLMIIRLAMLEGIALFGLVTLMQSVLGRLIYTNQNHWLLVLPLVILIVYTGLNNFSKEKILNRIEENILVMIRN